MSGKMEGMTILRNVPLKGLSTFRIGAKADLVAQPKSEDELERILAFSSNKRIRTLVIGNGSNVLFPDSQFRGIVIRLGNNLRSIGIDGETVTASSGIMLSSLIKKAASKGLGGLEFAYGVPATLGGAVISNFGAWGDNIGKFVKAVKGVKVVKGKVIRLSLPKNKLKFGYRHSNLSKMGIIITEVQLKLKRSAPKLIRAKLAKTLETRRQKQPLGIPNIGSIFRNPPGKFAGKLIQDAGLSGKRVGDAQISERHANFIINLGEAKQSDVLKLMKLAQKLVFSKFRVKLVPEIKIIR